MEDDTVAQLEEQLKRLQAQNERLSNIAGEAVRQAQQRNAALALVAIALIEQGVLQIVRLKQEEPVRAS